jgi:tRNA 2-thiouridine synthesizing protein A
VSAPRSIAVVVAGVDAAAEALRAAVGLTLRGARVVVVPLVALPADDRVARALGTLRALGHRVDGTAADADAADVVEVWTGSGGAAAATRPGPGGGPMRWLVRCAAEPHPPAAVVIDDTPAEILVDLLFAAGGAAVLGSAAETLDLRGEVCPYTFVRAKLRLEELPVGARLRVVVDHEPATRNIPRSAAEWGQRVLGVGPSGAGRWDLWIEKRTP